MRLCLNDSLIRLPFGSKSEEQVKTVHDIGFRVAGIGIDPDTTDSDIKRMKDLFAKYDMSFGPGSGASHFDPDPVKRRTKTERVKKVLEIAGKLGCPSVRCAGGSMDETNVWMHHPENHTQKAFDLYVNNTLELKPYAEAANVMICPETTQWTIIGSPKRMKEFVDRCDSPCVRVIFDFVNHMNSERVYKSGEFAMKVVGELGDRIGVFHVKDVMVQDSHLVSHIDETPLGTGILDHEAIIEASKLLEPWKTFSMEHFNQKDVPKEEQWVRGFKYMKGVTDRMGHVWTNSKCTRERWKRGECK